MRENLAIAHRVHPAVHLLDDHPPLQHALHLDLQHALHLRVQQLAPTRIVAVKIYLHAVVLAIAVALPEMSAQVVKSVIHGGFGRLRKIATNRVSVLESLNQIFQMRLLEKSWRKAFAQSC
jgi:hypothetical protein